MQARIVVVHDDPAFLASLADAFKAAGHDVAAFDDSMLAWDALKPETNVAILITRIRFPPGKPHGVALARRARAEHPDIRVIFTAAPEMRPYADDLGVFLPMPVNVPDVVRAVQQMLASDLAA